MEDVVDAVSDLSMARTQDRRAAGQDFSLFLVVGLPKGGRHRTWLEARKKVYTYIYI